MACPSACLGLSTLSVHNLEFVTFASGFSGLAGGASRVLCSVFANLPLNKSYQIYKYTGRQRHTHAAALCLQIQPKDNLAIYLGGDLLAPAAIHILHQNITDRKVKSLSLSPPTTSDP